MNSRSIKKNKNYHYDKKTEQVAELEGSRHARTVFQEHWREESEDGIWNGNCIVKTIHTNFSHQPQ
ncbi:hypothetical protein A3A93_00275 [Candidatus Roizmanbacteria bacterium RIFCSPLOWO2_01_FULL_38_12]|uniref:Uncharacterized protein n=1 Tax=Candidatus Roizmanbacteria bacterium RIFCSPLOWO2_01_FULL_38_12 TaxID=1802061 RepID=A0A1F7IUD6_9BACT|nr:MAG: hypothetical protein A3A93_00275 [Candidatus Roizmanbacteria bacterium RIFCSPLOWO2_01_FULL_38_12]